MSQISHTNGLASSCSLCISPYGFCMTCTRAAPGQIFSDGSVILKIILASEEGASGQVAHLDVLGGGGFVACVGMPPLTEDGSIKHMTLQDNTCTIPGTRVWKRPFDELAEFAKVTQQVQS
jgi:hypothetical protein